LISFTCVIGNGSVAPVFTLMPGSVNGFVQFMCRAALRSFARVGFVPLAASSFTTS